MGSVVEFQGPGRVRVTAEDPMPMQPDSVRVRTLYSGISAGTELTAFRGSNPYLSRRWDPDIRLFVDDGEPSFGYPVRGWGYQEVGTVLEVPDGVTSVAVGDVVYGIWGHRSEAVVPLRLIHPLPAGVDPVHAAFARLGAIALNAVLAARVVLGDRVVIAGQGVIGLLATRLATLSGADVIAVDAVQSRRDLAQVMGAVHVLDLDRAGGNPAQIREMTGGRGADAAIELSGTYPGLAEMVRSVALEGTVVAAGFYQGEASALRLGEEFHHNRVRIVASQIGGTPLDLGARWDHTRLNRTVLDLIARGRLDVAPLLSHVLDVDDVAHAFELIDAADPSVMQVVLRFGDAS